MKNGICKKIRTVLKTINKVSMSVQPGKEQNGFQIGFMRHPPVNVAKDLCYGHQDVPLLAGWQDYAVLPADFGVEFIYTSPLSRCLNLTKELTAVYQIPYQTDDRLMEFDFGEWEGKQWDDIPRELIDEWAANPWEWQVPGGETGQELLQRVLVFWNEIKERRQTVLVVSHGGPLRLLRQIAMNKPVELLGELPGFGQLEIFIF